MRRPRQRRRWRHVLAVPSGKVTGKKSIREGILCGELVVCLDECVALGLLLPLLRCDARPIHELFRSRPLVAADLSEPLLEPWVEGAEGASPGPKVEQHLA